VIFLEPTRLYRLFRQEVADDGQALPLDACFTLRDGTDLTLVSWGAMLRKRWPRPMCWPTKAFPRQ
jgi:pyruvate dehydrogenase E1 component beta subunit